VNNKFYYLQYIMFIAPLLWLVSGMILIPDGDTYMGVVCLLSSLLIVLIKGKPNFWQSLKKDKVLLVYVSYLSYAVFSYYYHGYSSRELKAILFSTLYLVVFPREMYSQKLLSSMVVIGSVVLTVLSYYQYFFLDMSRVGGHINPNVMAAYSGILCVLCACFGLYSTDYRRRILFGFLFLLSITSVTMTLTRGVVMPLLFVFLVLLVFRYIRVSKKKLLLFCLLTMFFAIFISKVFFQERLKHIEMEVDMIAEGNLNSSLGMRFQLWGASYYSIFERPVLGLGDDYESEFYSYYKQGLITEHLFKATGVQSHYHNQYIDKLVKYGFLGVVVLILLMLSPVFYSFSFRSPSLYGMAILGIVLHLSFAGLTDVPLNHSYIVYMYFLFMFICLKLEDKRRNNVEG
jgi:O-antigen ligase